MNPSSNDYWVRVPVAESDHILEILPCSQYYLRSLSWTSRTFYFLDSRDLLDVLRDFIGRERGGGVHRES